MSTKTQAKLEAQLAQRQTRVEKGTLTSEKAFGTMEEWILQLGKHKAFLLPHLKQWLLFDRLHDEWVFAGCGIREGILMEIESGCGVKKLPYEDNVANWCVLVQDGVPLSPLRIDEIHEMLGRGQVKPGSLIWTTQANNWLPANDPRVKEIIFGKSAA